MPKKLNIARPPCPECGKPLIVIDTKKDKRSNKRTRWMGCKLCKYRDSTKRREQNPNNAVLFGIDHRPIASDGDNSSIDQTEEIKTMLQQPFTRDAVCSRYGITSERLNDWIENDTFPAAGIQDDDTELWLAGQILNYESARSGLPMRMTRVFA